MHSLPGPRALAPRWALPAVLGVLVVLSACSEGAGETSGEGSGSQEPPEVPVRELATESVTVSRIYTGRTRGAREVEIRTRVDGVLAAREYTEGSSVEPGDALFRIAPEPFEARVESARAQLERARAEERQAEREWERVDDLYQDDAASGRERDEARSALELARAEVLIAEAAVGEARIDLDFTLIESPLRGVAGMEERPVGSLLDAGELLTTVVELDPIHVGFSIPEHDMRQFGSQIRGGVGIGVRLQTGDDSYYPVPGWIDFTEASIDEVTGTVEGRAVFRNPDDRLLPGQFVRLELSGLDLGTGMRLPETAIFEHGGNAAVYVVDGDERVERRVVSIDTEFDGQVLISDGLEDGDRVVIDGTSGIDEGDAVRARVVGVGDDEMPSAIAPATLPPALGEDDPDHQAAARADFLLVFPHAPDVPVLIPVPAEEDMRRPGVPLFLPFAPDIQMILPVHALTGDGDSEDADVDVVDGDVDSDE